MHTVTGNYDKGQQHQELRGISLLKVTVLLRPAHAKRRLYPPLVPARSLEAAVVAAEAAEVAWVPVGCS